jgi:hypothetical protein
MEFTSLHDVSIDYLVERLVACQKRDVEALQSCARRLAGDVTGNALVEDIVNASRRRLEALERLRHEPAVKS